MIEIIQETAWDEPQERRGLPKNIKQIGSPDMGDRIYIENKAYQKMHPYGRHAEKAVYIMLGRFDEYAGCDYVFVENVIEMDEVPFGGNVPIWSDESWAALYRKLRPEHENMIIVGWAVDICGQLPNMTAQLEHVHKSYFGGVHQVLFLMDTLEREEAFYSNRNGYLKRRAGFQVYYDKVNGTELERVSNVQPERQIDMRMATRRDESDREKSYREYLNSRNNYSRHSHSRRTQQSPQNHSYLPTLLLLAVAVTLSYSAYQNYKKTEELRLALNQMNEMQAVMQTETVEADVVRVEEIVGSISTQATEQMVTEQAEVSAQLESEQVTETAQVEESIATEATVSTEINIPTEVSTQTATEVLSEAEQYLAQGYYIVQAGDNLAGISRKIYHTTAMMDEICEINGIDNADAIYVGQYLELPK